MTQTIVQPNIFPILLYRDATAAMAWLARAFGFETRMEVPGPDGTVAHAELRLGAGTIGVSSKTPPDGKNPWTTVDQGVYVCVDNPDAHHDRAKAEGAAITEELVDLPVGHSRYTCRDPEGHEWSFAQAQNLEWVDVVTSASKDPVRISAESVGKTIAGAKVAVSGNDLQLDTSSFYKPTEAGAYPIVLTTYELVCSKYPDAETGTAVKAFLQSTIGGGQDGLAEHGYVPLPKDFQEKVDTAVNAIS